MPYFKNDIDEHSMPREGQQERGQRRGGEVERSMEMTPY